MKSLILPLVAMTVLGQVHQFPPPPPPKPYQIAAYVCVNAENQPAPSGCTDNFNGTTGTAFVEIICTCTNSLKISAVDGWTVTSCKSNWTLKVISTVAGVKGVSPLRDIGYIYVQATATGVQPGTVGPWSDTTQSSENCDGDLGDSPSPPPLIC